MQLSEEEEENNLSLSKFESMLKTNKVLFFDSEEFEEIILHYILILIKKISTDVFQCLKIKTNYIIF